MPGLIEQQTDLRLYPRVIKPALPQLTLGDVHGNGLLLLHFLMSSGVVGVSKTDYDWFVTIYQSPLSQLDARHFAYFDKIIDAAVINPGISLRFLGDMVADRGSNDYFVIKLLDRLAEAGVNYEVILSNHDAEFIINYELFGLSGDYHALTIDSNYTQSRHFLSQAIKEGKLDKKLIEPMIERGILSKVKALSVAPGAGHTLSIYSHAPIGLNSIRRLAEELGLPCHMNSLKGFIHSVAGINRLIYEAIQTKTLHHYLATLNSSIPKDSAHWASQALRDLIWNRDYSQLDRPAEIDMIETWWLYFIHGHDSQESLNSGYIITLDAVFGKGLDKLDGQLRLTMGDECIVPADKLYGHKLMKPTEFCIYEKLAKLFLIKPLGGGRVQMHPFYLHRFKSAGELERAICQSVTVDMAFLVDIRHAFEMWQGLVLSARTTNVTHGANSIFKPQGGEDKSKDNALDKRGIFKF